MIVSVVYHVSLAGRFVCSGGAEYAATIPGDLTGSHSNLSTMTPLGSATYCL